MTEDKETATGVAERIAMAVRNDNTRAAHAVMGMWSTIELLERVIEKQIDALKLMNDGETAAAMFELVEAKNIHGHAATKMSPGAIEDMAEAWTADLPNQLPAGVKMALDGMEEATGNALVHFEEVIWALRSEMTNDGSPYPQTERIMARAETNFDYAMQDIIECREKLKDILS